MGGLGSGGHNARHRSVVEAHRRLDVRLMQKEGVLTDGWIGQWTWTSSDGETNLIRLFGGRETVRLAYNYRINGGAWQEIDEPVAIDWSPRRFGGAQAFFLCPKCAKRARYLYGAGARFLCRGCHGLVNESSRQSDHDRALRKAQSLRRRLGGDPGFDMPIADRPQYMRKDKYNSIVARIETAEREVMDHSLLLLRRLDNGSGKSVEKGFWS